MSIIAAVDPGYHGAICVLSTLAVDPLLYAMPITEGARPSYDLFAIREKLMEAQDAGLPRLYVERSQPLPAKMGGGLANWHRGRSQGLWEGLCYCLEIPVEFVEPRRWQKVMLAGCQGETTKDRALVAAQRLFPGLDLRRTPKCRKADEGFVDALLLAEWGRRQCAVL